MGHRNNPVLVPGDGIEPPTRAFSERRSTTELPRLNRGLNVGWWRWEGSNFRPWDYDSPALPLSYTADSDRGEQTRMPLPPQAGRGIRVVVKMRFKSMRGILIGSLGPVKSFFHEKFFRLPSPNR